MSNGLCWECRERIGRPLLGDFPWYIRGETIHLHCNHEPKRGGSEGFINAYFDKDTEFRALTGKGEDVKMLIRKNTWVRIKEVPGLENLLEIDKKCPECGKKL